MTRTLQIVTRAVRGYASIGVCLIGALVLAFAIANIALAAWGGDCQGLTVYNTVTGQIQGPYCKNNSCAATCDVQQSVCDAGHEGPACYCQGAEPEGAVCESTNSPGAPFPCCPQNCPGTKPNCTFHYSAEPPEGYKPSEYDPQPPPDTPTLSWRWCSCDM